MSCLHALYDAFVSISVPSDKAQALGESLERDMLTHLSTESDVDALRKDMTTWLGAVQIIGMGRLFAAPAFTSQDAQP
jgi:hypothetical protein